MATPRVVETLNVPHVPLDTSLAHLPVLSDHRRMNASASPAPVTALTPEEGDAATASCPRSCSCGHKLLTN